MSGVLNLFRSLTGADSRLGFYTKATRERIPEVPGCYAWILPFWFYNDHLPDLVSSMVSVLNYEPKPEKHTRVPFNWDSIELAVSRTHSNFDSNEHTKLNSTWESILADKEAKLALQQTLLEASLLLPPLYIGRTNNLKKRYLQHAGDSAIEINNFNSRFTNCVKDLGLKLSVSDLLFICIETPHRLRQFFGDDDSETNQLIEQILIRICHPPFSIR